MATAAYKSLMTGQLEVMARKMADQFGLNVEDVVGIATPEGVEPQKGHEVNVLAGIAARHSVLARGLTLKEGRAEQEGQEEQSTVHGAKVPLHMPSCLP